MDNQIESMLCEAIYRNDKLYISMEWFCRFAYNFQVSEFDNVMYITDHYAEISRYIVMASAGHTLGRSELHAIRRGKVT